MSKEIPVHKSDYHPPSLRSILLGVVLAVVLVIWVFAYLPDTIKIAGDVLLLIPEQLGLVQRVHAGEVHVMSLANPQATIRIPKAGRYAVYTGDLDLLERIGLVAKPLLEVVSQPAGQAVELSFVRRGLRPYDTPRAKGRPIYRFAIQQPGFYQVTYLGRSIAAVVSIAPDYATGKESTITLAYVLQVGLLVLLPGAVYYRRRKVTKSLEKQLQQQKRAAMDKFVRGVIEPKDKSGSR
jgi:hypothetical protein